MKKLIFVPLLIIGGLFSANRAQAWNYGAGEQTGYIEGIQQEGYVWKNHYLFIKSSVDASQADRYCVHRDNIELIQDLKKVSQSGKRVTIKYDRLWYIVGAFGRCAGDTVREFKISEF